MIGHKVRKLLVSGASAFALSTSVFGAEAEFQIPPGDLESALTTYINQSGEQLIYRVDDLRGISTKGLQGRYETDDALEILLDDTGFEARRESSDAAVIVRTGLLDDTTAIETSRRVRVAQADTVNDASNADDDKRDNLKRDEIVVTGTNIRGIAPESSPTRVYSREDVIASGAATAQGFIQTLPQNFSGGSNPVFASGLPSEPASQANATGGLGASVNLRGLGSGSTLVLLNGRRLAPSSPLGDFVDISMIPASAISRVEVLTDGASSIYGADAVAGVVNFVLRDDFDGVETSLRYGTVTQGDRDEYRASIIAGKSWNTGNAMVAYEYFNEDNLSAADRSFAQPVELPNDLLPSQKRHNVVVSASQELTPDLEVFGDFTFSDRETERFRTLFFSSELRAPSSRNLNASIGGSWNVGGDWFVDFSGAYSDVHIDADSSGDNPLVIDIDTDIWAGDAKASGTVFSVPGGDVKLAIGGHYRSENLSSVTVVGGQSQGEASRDVYAVFGEAFIPIVGEENAVPGIQRLEVNVSGRFSDFSDFGSTANPKVGVMWSPVEALRLRGSYSTSFNPPSLGQVGATDRGALAFSTAFFNNLLGFTPGDPSIADVVAISVFGTEKNLDAETSRAFTGGFDFSKEFGRQSIDMTLNFFDIKFKDRLGRIPTPDGTSVQNAPNIAFNSPELFPDGSIIFNPTLAQITEAIDSLDNPIIIFPPGNDPLDAEILQFISVTRNLGLTKTRGLDFDLSYLYEADIGDFSLGLDGTYLLDFQQQAVATSPIVDLVDTQFNPVDLNLRARGGYARDGFAANVFVNYTDGYRVDNTPNAADIDSWVTVDLNLSYNTGEQFGNPAFRNTTVRLSVLNLFDQDPPFAPGSPNFGIAGFDPTNASPLNRFIAVELTKRF